MNETTLKPGDTVTWTSEFDDKTRYGVFLGLDDDGRASIAANTCNIDLGHVQPVEANLDNASEDE
jgi:plastocyanin